MNWAQQQRMQYIKNLLESQGFMNRRDLMVKFDICMPQASIDVREFLRLHPETMKYNRSAKRYERS